MFCPHCGSPIKAEGFEKLFPYLSDKICKGLGIANVVTTAQCPNCQIFWDYYGFFDENNQVFIVKLEFNSEKTGIAMGWLKDLGEKQKQ